MAFQGFAAWLREHVVDYPTFTHEHGVGVTIYRQHLSYGTRALFDTATLGVHTGVCSRADGGLLMVDTTIRGRDADVARVSLTLVPVLIAEADALSAQPGPLPPALLARFQPDELEPETRRPVVQPLIRRTQSAAGARFEATKPFTIHRHHCELADQWCFLAVPDLVAEARERMCIRGDATLRLGLTALQSIDIELGKPFAFLDEGIVATTAFIVDGRPVFVHRLTDARGTVHGTVVERMAAAGAG